MRHGRFPCYTIKDKGTNGIAKKDIWYNKLGINGIAKIAYLVYFTIKSIHFSIVYL